MNYIIIISLIVSMYNTYTYESINKKYVVN